MRFLKKIFKYIFGLHLIERAELKRMHKKAQEVARNGKKKKARKKK